MFHDTPGIERIKFVTNFPKDMSTDLLEAIRDLPKCARYLHVPLQHGCNHQLQKMKRGYTLEDYREMMGRIREILPDCAVSSDFIVGFCSESEASFLKSVDAVREFRFKNSFIFKYSPRPGTKAHELYLDDIPEEEKKRRNNELLRVQNEISEEDNAAFIGRRVEVLVEGLSKRASKGIDADPLPGWHAGPEPVAGNSGIGSQGSDDLVSLNARPSAVNETHDAARDQSPPARQNLAMPHNSAAPVQLVGRTKCDRIVVFEGNPRLAGSLAEIEIDDATQTTLLGSIITRHVQPGSGGLLPILV
jgi:tRNA-2-methylthio-N6-dimethylallyladenosine synthase